VYGPGYSFQCTRFLRRCVYVAGDTERSGEVAAGFVVCWQGQVLAEVDRCPGLAAPVAEVME